ncbi:hypothetical protein OUZ56_011804 [Daphnia magna]|uniref:Uncharacterized protein n=1 Tax=Daphnia magna TaxID=35525 RepID=A0ABQ9Z170_9CRUS|nr:hypothetical protein OUZ56_011804 [Daphnia magna]
MDPCEGQLKQPCFYHHTVDASAIGAPSSNIGNTVQFTPGPFSPASYGEWCVARIGKWGNLLTSMLVIKYLNTALPYGLFPTERPSIKIGNLSGAKVSTKDRRLFFQEMVLHLRQFVEKRTTFTKRGCQEEEGCKYWYHMAVPSSVDAHVSNSKFPFIIKTYAISPGCPGRISFKLNNSSKEKSESLLAVGEGFE